MTDSDSDGAVPREYRRRILQLLYGSADTPNSTFSVRELASAVNTDAANIIREIEQNPDLLYNRELNTVQVRQPAAARTKLMPWQQIEGVVKKAKHRRPLGKSSDIRAALDSTMGRVGYVCVADEFLLEDLDRYYSDQGYYTKFDYDVLHIRFSDKELTQQQQQQQRASQQQTATQAPSASGGYGATGTTVAAPTAGGGKGRQLATSASGVGGPRDELLAATSAGDGSFAGVPLKDSGGAPNAPRRIGFDLFVFQYGAIVWWGFDQKYFKIVEQDFMFPSSKIQKYLVNRYKTQLIHENYPVWCTFSLERKETVEPDDDFKERLLFDHFLIPYSWADINSACISMLCASHALAQSAKIDYLEIKIQELTQGCKPLPRELKEFGRVTITERRLLQLRGEVLSYRLMLKSGSDLLDEPELFWQNAYLKPIFQATKECFEITERVRALDTKLDADHEILGMIADQFHERHGARLEWIVIWLVLVEVIIGVLELLLDVRPWVK